MLATKLWYGERQWRGERDLHAGPALQLTVMLAHPVLSGLLVFLQ